MDDKEVDWSLTTYEGNRRRQHREFYALPFHEKLRQLEEMDKLFRFFEEQRLARMKAADDPKSHPSDRARTDA